MLIVSKSSPVTGLANASNELYVSDSAANRIRVYDAETMAELRSWSVDRPKQIAVDTQSNTISLTVCYNNNESLRMVARK